MAKKKQTPAKKATAITKDKKTLSHVEVWVWVYGEGWQVQDIIVL